MSSPRSLVTRRKVSISLAFIVFLLAVFSLNRVGLPKESRPKKSPPKAPPSKVEPRPTAPVLAASAQTRTIILNTGYDQWLASPALINVGQLDNEWRVIFDTTNQPPPRPPATGRPADVVSDDTWADSNPSLSSNFPTSRWISIKANQGRPLPIPPNRFQYAYYFTLPAGFSNPELKMKLSSDDHITKVTLNSTTLFQGSGGIFINPPLVLPTSALTSSDFNSGPVVNLITVDVEDTGAGITGLIVDGQVTYEDCGRRPIRDIADLTSITFWESTFAAPASPTFAVNGSELTNRLSGTLTTGNSDFESVPGLEAYDFFYSDWNGDPNPNGQFVTIEAETHGIGAPSGGGLNIARVDFNGTGKFASSVASFVALGNNAMPDDVGKAVDLDPNILTDTTMGNTSGQKQRLRVTVGFPCACTPPPAGMVAWWPLDGLNSAGEYEDLAGGDNNGTPIGKPSQVLGQYVNNSLATGVIDGVQVSPATNLNFGTGPFTIDAWVKPGPTDQAESIVSKQRGSNSGYSLFLESGRLHFQSGSLVLAGPQVSPNQWNFVAVVVEPPYVTLYVGTPFSSNLSQVSYGIPANTGLPTNSTINATNNEALIIGRSLSLNPFSNGIIIDEVEIFNRALNQRPELESIFDAGAVGKCNVLSCPAITINPITLVHPTWVANVDYPPLNLTATGVTGPYTFSVTGGTLPPGMVVDPNGTLRGRPVTPGTYDFTVKAADANGCLGMHRYQMIVAPPPCNHGNNLIENGGFETGNFDGWSLSYGNLDDGATKVDKNDWNDTLPSDHPAPSIITAASATINKQGKKIDPYCGTGMLRFNDLGGEYDATRVRRSITLTNISPCTRIQLVWGAMLEDARHAAKDSPKIEIEITRKAGKDKSTKSIYSFRADATERAAGGWEDIRQPGGENPIWYKTATVTRNVGEFENGDELDIELIVYDCNQKKHGGAAFLDCVELIDACTGNCPDPNKSPIPNPTIPNVFTPNGDGLNDLWSISNVYNACYAHVDIFNRFGNLVATNDAYELTGYTGKSIVLWDGLIDSKPSSDGTYYYLLKLKNCNESKEFTGFITVFHEAPCYTEVVSDEVEAKQHLASKNKAKRNWEDKVEVTYGKAYAKWGRAKGKDISCNKTGKKSNKKWHCVARGRPCTK